MSREQKIEKIAKPIRSRLSSIVTLARSPNWVWENEDKEITSHAYYAAKDIYEASHLPPEQTEQAKLEIMPVWMKDIFEERRWDKSDTPPEQTDKREAIKYILDVKSSQRCGTERCLSYPGLGCNVCLTDQILSLFPPPELLSDDVFDNWYNWFTNMLGRKSDKAERNAIHDLLQAQAQFEADGGK